MPLLLRLFPHTSILRLFDFFQFLSTHISCLLMSENYFYFTEVMSADCFAAFEEVGLDNEEAVRKTGRRFRETVLAMGGGKHPSEVYKAFRGRDPDPAALLRHIGLSK